MNILEQLSSGTGEKPLVSNRAVAEWCIVDPRIIDEIASNICNKNLKIAADCSEVMTMIAESRPDLIVPYTQTLFSFLTHKKSNVRWECCHALALTAHLLGGDIPEKLVEILRVIENDDSIIVRDYAIDILAGYAKIGEAEACIVYKYLVKAMTVHLSRHAGHAIDGFMNVIAVTNVYNSDIAELIEPYLFFEKKIVATKANKLNKIIQKRIVANNNLNTE